MLKSKTRDYNCKDEELPVAGGFLSFSYNRDLAEFSAYSPKFTASYGEEFAARNESVKELVQPKSEANVLKTITKRMYACMDGLLPSINRLVGYIDMAYDELKLTPADMGIADLRKGIRSKDPESVLKNLKSISTDIATYNNVLAPHGLNGNLTAVFSQAYTEISAFKQQKYEISSNRTAIVQNNIEVMNELWNQMSEILKVGKILFSNSDAAKLQDYSFTHLMKQVRRVIKNDDEPVVDKPAVDKPAPETT
jgi:hypothetical protein